jgi:hypothetical protein
MIESPVAVEYGRDARTRNPLDGASSTISGSYRQIKIRTSPSPTAIGAETHRDAINP